MSDQSDNAVSLEQAVIDLSLAIGQLRRRLRAEAETSELNISQMAALVRLHHHGSMTTADLARAESMKPQSMGTILASLEVEGLVSRERDPTDGRQVQFRLTQKGSAVRRADKLARRDWLLSAMKKLAPDEQGRLISAIALIKRLGDS
ncbi:MarR family transcriptional regulator [Sphingomonas oligophenolica]|uniref:MarR family transcriptional regulator n=1 Tax=Sphingomonas oligophenolica TaxID=301154 RepID=A0ABU9YB36_9SPHN